MAAVLTLRSVSTQGSSSSSLEHWREGPVGVVDGCGS